MKKLIVVILLVVAVVLYLRAKMAEHDRLANTVEEFFYAACDGDSAASDRLVMLRPCLSEGYRFSVVPGGDGVSMDAVVSCLNGAHPVPGLTALREAETPFPTAR